MKYFSDTNFANTFISLLSQLIFQLCLWLNNNIKFANTEPEFLIFGLVYVLSNALLKSLTEHNGEYSFLGFILLPLQFYYSHIVLCVYWYVEIQSYNLLHDSVFPIPSFKQAALCPIFVILLPQNRFIHMCFISILKISNLFQEADLFTVMFILHCFVSLKYDIFSGRKSLPGSFFFFFWNDWTIIK